MKSSRLNPEQEPCRNFDLYPDMAEVLKRLE
jgi:hypothetical protein